MMLNRTTPFIGALQICAFLTISTGLLAQAGQSSFGHARARELAALGKLPTSSDIVVRDIVNYRRHLLPLPTVNQAVSLDIRSDRGGARRGKEMWLQVGYATRSEGDRALSPPCAVTLVVDCSGSMQERGKMSQVHAGLRAFVQRLRPNDQIAIVAFSTEARVVMPLRRRGEGQWLQATIATLQPGGGTNLHAGLMLGIKQLQRGGIDKLGKLSKRVVLLTDGIATEGITQSSVIANDARDRAEHSIDISTIGVGQNLDTALLGQLARTNRGLFHFVADEQDVAKVFVAEADSLLVPAARDVELQIELPRGIASAQVLGGRASVDGQTLTIPMPNLNAGATGVVMLRCKVAERARDPMIVTAQITFQHPMSGTRAREHATASLWVERPKEAVATDLEVRKNAAIAVLARGLRKMAMHSEERRWADASRVLRGAREAAKRLFPGQDDDVQHVRDIAKGHQVTLRGYVDRFRNL
jgi:Ca-activated chloride channel family protein